MIFTAADMLASLSLLACLLQLTSLLMLASLLLLLFGTLLLIASLLLLSLLLLAWYCRLWSCWGLCCLASKLLQAAQLLLCPTVAAIFADVPTVAGVLGTLLLQLFCCWCPYRCEIPAVAGTACVCYTHCSIPADPSGPHIKA